MGSASWMRRPEHSTWRIWKMISSTPSSRHFSGRSVRKSCCTPRRVICSSVPKTALSMSEQGNLSVPTQRLLRNVLPASTLWESFRDIDQFYTAEATLELLAEEYQTTKDADNSGKAMIPETIEQMMGHPLAIEALGGMMFYIKGMNLGKDLMSQRNFNIYDPIREGKSMVLDGQTLSHMEVSPIRARLRV